MNFEEYNILGTIINDSFGQSTEEHAGAFKIVAKIQKENLDLSVAEYLLFNPKFRGI